MNLRTIGVLARKEFKDVLRDRRTLFFMVLLPMVAMPVIMIAGSRFVKKQAAEKEQRVLQVATNAGGERVITGLRDRWMADNQVAVGLTIAKFGIDSLDDQEAIADFFVRLGKARQAGGGEAGGELMAAMYEAWQKLPEEQQRLLLDYGAVNRFMSLTKFRRFRSLPKEGKLSPGVKIPDDMPDAEALNLPPDASLPDPEVVALAVQEKVVHGALYVPTPGGDEASAAREVFVTLDEGRAYRIDVLYDASISLSKEFLDRFEGFMAALERDEMRRRVLNEGLRSTFVAPFDLEPADIASASRKLQGALGGLLPYLIIVFCFLGAFYPALDLTAGEKERFTLETLLLSPISRLDIAAGKFVVVFVAAVTAAILFTTSMFITVTQGVLPEGLLAGLDFRLEPLAIVLTLSLLLPIAAVIAALVLGVALCGRSFKEAQNYVAPLQILFIIPGMVAFLPDLETETHLAWIPLVNVSLLMKELLKGNYLWDFYWITLGSLLLMTALVLWGSSLLFRRESVLMRT